MIIVYVNPFFTEGMGYIENCLPIAMAKRGHKVHIITSTGKVYFNDPLYEETYQKHYGPPIVASGVTEIGENLFLHRLEFVSIMNTFYFKGLKQKLKEIHPDIVHMWEIFAPFTLQFALLKRKFNYQLYSGNHYLLSVFPLHRTWENQFSLKKWRWYFLKTLPGKLISNYFDRCYAATDDAKFVAMKYMGVPESLIQITPLGVDTDVFRPVDGTNETVIELRKQLGIKDDEFVVIYTGRFTKGKNPLLLARAIEKLKAQGYTKIVGLFLGAGEQKEAILNCKCIVVDFVQYLELIKYYQCADIGVWPTQESTSMLDAAAAGLPIVVNDTILATERYVGNGLTYKLGDVDDLASKILLLYRDENMRIEFKRNGVKKVQENFSWARIAKDREVEYIKDLNKSS